MMRRKFLFCWAVLAGIAMAGLAPPAQAAFEVRYSISGGAFVVLGSTTSNPGSVSGSVDGINITATGSDILGAAKSTIDLAVSGILNQSITSLIVEASVVSVPTAPPPQTLVWSFTGSSDAGVSETGQSWVDQSNQLYGGATGGPGGTNIVATSGPLSVPSTGSKGFTASAVLGYSFTVQYTAGAAAAGTTLSTDDKQSITNAPAPAGLFLVLSAMPVLGLGKWLRRRRVGVAS